MKTCDTNTIEHFKVPSMVLMERAAPVSYTHLDVYKRQVLVLYKNYKNKYEGWVLPKGTVEPGEEFKDTAAREVLEETGVDASIIKYVGKSQYSFTVPEDTVAKQVHWYLMMADLSLIHI